MMVFFPHKHVQTLCYSFTHTTVKSQPPEGNMAGKQGKAAAVVRVWDERPPTLHRLPPRPGCGPHLSSVFSLLFGSAVATDKVLI